MFTIAVRKAYALALDVLSPLANARAINDTEWSTIAWRNVRMVCNSDMRPRHQQIVRQTATGEDAAAVCCLF
ncbi:hypothetical protein, partial [Sodalis-like endosymbiont of Proechinophthirus fluctus]|uniref:hypothetical protein n=1 Tax=Sodalis-like endosymbiont of Proechinophthirus fluctus TaxID=1462730 RepID=UPI0019577B93